MRRSPGRSGRLRQRNLRKRSELDAALRRAAMSYAGRAADGGWGNRQPAGLWSLAVSVRVRVPQPTSDPANDRYRRETPSCERWAACRLPPPPSSSSPPVRAPACAPAACPRCCTASPAAPCSATCSPPPRRWAPPRTVVVVGHRRDEVVAHLADIAPAAVPVVQAEQRGTGHAVRLALEALPADATRHRRGRARRRPAAHRHRPGRARRRARRGRGGRHAADQRRSPTRPATGGWSAAPDGAVARVVEHKDATRRAAAVAEVATSVYAFDLAAAARRAGPASPRDNAAGRGVPARRRSASCVADGRPVAAVTAPADETAGVQRPRPARRRAPRLQPPAARGAHARRRHRGRPGHDLGRRRRRARARRHAAPGGRAARPHHRRRGRRDRPGHHPHRHRGRRRRRSSPAPSRSARASAPDVTVGPFAYLRPGTELADGVHVGTYVEIKNSRRRRRQQGAAPDLRRRRHDRRGQQHRRVDASSSTTTASRSTAASIGDHVRIGSDTMIVAPRDRRRRRLHRGRVGHHRGRPAGAMAVARARQRNVAGWVAAQTCRDAVRRRRRAGPGRGRARRRPADRRGRTQMSTLQVAGRKSLVCCPAAPSPSWPTRSPGTSASPSPRRRGGEFANGELFIRPNDSVRGTDAFVDPVAHDADQRVADGEPDPRRRAQARVGQAHHRRRAVLPLRPAGQEAPRPRADLGPADRRPVQDRRRRPADGRRPAHRADPGLLRRPRRPPVRACRCSSSYVREKYARPEDLVVVSPDTGRVRMAEQWADELGGLDIAFVHKTPQHRRRQRGRGQPRGRRGRGPRAACSSTT